MKGTTKKNRTWAVFADCLKKHRATALVFAVYTVISLVIFSLYNLVLEPFMYAAVLIGFFVAALFCIDFAKELNRAAGRERALASLGAQISELPPANSLAEADYREMLRVLGKRLEELTANFENEHQDMLDYFTAWVHQIKTPIAVMRLRIGGEDTDEHRALAAELFRIEQYVDMVLQYIRLGSETNDLVIKEYSLDELIRDSVRKYAGQFIYRKVKLEYEPTDLKIVTDRKWFSCIIEQILSNAIKYTPEGTVTIRVSDEGILRISDTGIGIAAEDLPRIFEMGYTGSNGRMEERLGQKSSGLGLYLCKKAADMLSIPVNVESAPGRGSTFILDLRQKRNGKIFYT